ncbi:MAG: DUF1513 domain-containing protein [Pseudomonadota bacterium]
MPSRRSFLAGLLGTSATVSLGWAAVGNPAALTAAKNAQGSHLLIGLKASGDIAFSLPLPARGHAAAAHPHVAEAVAIARRPGTFAKVIDCATGAVLQTLRTPVGRHFYGHAAFSADGALLFTTENDVATGNGRIGVWDRTLSYRRVDEFSSTGIGPHEILRLPGGHLAVANGGIRTHPASGRDKLNLDTMRPNLSIFNASGALIDQAEVEDATHQNSLRHIAAAADGTVICGFQWQGDPFAAPPLVALYAGAGKLRPADMDEASLHGLGGYIGSVSAFGASYAASAPRGGRAFRFDKAGVQTGQFRADDICGLCAAPDSTGLATDGMGNVYRIAVEGMHVLRTHPLAFDNHLVALA